jgi:hypothetical protein
MGMSLSVLDNGILRRMIGTGSVSLHPEVAGFFLSLSLTDADNERISALSEKANDGVLTADERDELGLYVVLADFIAIMQSKARASLLNQSPAA